jgi:predicted lipid-binding transport protein (Tim44 family)
MSVRASPACAPPIGQTEVRPGLLGGGLFGGIAAGFLGAGLFGLLLGKELFGGMAGFASIIGLLLQVMLVVIVARLIFAWWQRRNMPAPAYAAATGHSFGSLAGMLVGTNAPPSGESLTVAKSHHDAFGLLGDIQAAYSAEDLSALRAKVTPEMLSYFSEQLADNASRGLINRVTDVKLRQGDLAEAWRLTSSPSLTRKSFELIFISSLSMVATAIQPAPRSQRSRRKVPRRCYSGATGGRSLEAAPADR